MKIRKTPHDPPPAEVKHAVNQTRKPKFTTYDYRAMAELATLQRYAREQDPVSHPTPPPIPEKTLGQVVRYRTWTHMPFGKYSKKYGTGTPLEEIAKCDEDYLVWVVTAMELRHHQGLRETIEGLLLQNEIQREKEDPWRKINEGL